MCVTQLFILDEEAENEGMISPKSQSQDGNSEVTVEYSFCLLGETSLPIVLLKVVNHEAGEHPDRRLGYGCPISR